VAATLPIAFGLAWLLARTRFPGRMLLDVAVHLPLVLPPVVTGWVLLGLFGPAGPLGRALASVGIEIAFRWTGAALAAGGSTSLPAFGVARGSARSCRRRRSSSLIRSGLSAGLFCTPGGNACARARSGAVATTISANAATLQPLPRIGFSGARR